MVMRVLLLGALSLALHAAHAQQFEWALELERDYFIAPDITYLEVSGRASRLDLIRTADTQSPRPVLLYIHGGGWIGLSKNHVFLHFLPYLQMGFAVVNVDYRLAEAALAPAAVEDTRCALRWVHEHADEHGLDASRIVVSGHSAGGHLSLTTGMLPAAAGLDRHCPAPSPSAPDTGGETTDGYAPEMPVAAIVNWFGITDVADLLEGPNSKRYAQEWIGQQRKSHEIAVRVSPLTYVRPDVPPILTIHGDADTVVPYAHAVRLHAALGDAGHKSHKLLTIDGGGHGGFSLKDSKLALRTIQKFLREQEIID